MSAGTHMCVHIVHVVMGVRLPRELLTHPPSLPVLIRIMKLEAQLKQWSPGWLNYPCYSPASRVFAENFLCGKFYIVNSISLLQFFIY